MKDLVANGAASDGAGVSIGGVYRAGRRLGRWAVRMHS